MTEKLEVPRRKVRKDWYVGLHPDPVDRSHPDVDDASLAKESSDKNSMSGKHRMFSWALMYHIKIFSMLLFGF